jgi:photosystem II stability/assembly factor-like uncharacterized protein
MKIWLLAMLLAAGGTAQAQWEMESSGTTADLRGIDNVGSGVAWASGTNGTVLRTEDGGYLWQACAVPPGAEHLDFRGVQAFDANTAIVMSSGKGDLSRLYKTTDGCHTWKLVFTNPDEDGFWDGLVAFEYAGIASEKMGFILGDPVDGRFAFFASTDGDLVRWQPFDHLVGYPLSKIPTPRDTKEELFAASNSTFVIDPSEWLLFITGGSAGSYIYSTTYDVWPVSSKGFTFETHKLPMAVSDSAGAFSYEATPSCWPPRSTHSYFSSESRRSNAFFENCYEVVVGGDYLKPDNRNGTAAYRGDQDQNWHAAQTPPHGYRSAVAYDAASKTWITVGPNGTDISTDDGKNWRTLHPDPAMHEAAGADRDWNALSPPFVVGPRGRIGKLNAKALAH